jgi:hypothetical protein
MINQLVSKLVIAANLERIIHILGFLLPQYCEVSKMAGEVSKMAGEP